MDVHPTKNVSIGIDPYPYFFMAHLDSHHENSETVAQFPSLFACTFQDVEQAQGSYLHVPGGVKYSIRHINGLV